MRSFIIFIALLLPLPAFSATVWLEEMTSPELREAIQAGYTTAIIPTGGTEQNGPHMALGKHNTIIRYTSEQIALKLGNAIVAPVMAYVPEGRISPPEGHMAFAGTLTIPDVLFAAILESTVRSLKQHGFKTICLIGDSGGNQKAQSLIAEKLTGEWKDENVKVLHIADYYDGAKNGQDAWLTSLGFTPEQIGTHAGLADTSELMALNESMIRPDKRNAYKQVDFEVIGAVGDASKASADIGKKLLELKIEAAVKAILAAKSQ